MSKYLITLLLSFVFSLLSLSPASIIHVPQEQPSIQAGINAAFPGDTVLVADSTYYENIDFKGKAITVASYILIDGDTTHINSTIIDGSKPSDPDDGSVVYFVSGEDTTSVLCGFTITGGTGTETIAYEAIKCRAGGGILCYNAGALILNNKITSNTVTSLDKMIVGGGVAALPHGSTACVIIQNNQIIQNTLTANTGDVAGGGVELCFDGKLINNQISNNSVVQNSLEHYAFSGGVDCDCPNAILESNKITHNSLVSHSNVPGSSFAGGVTILGCQGRLSKNYVSNNTIWVNTDRGGHGAGVQIMQTADSFIVDGNFISENAVIHGKGWGGGANIAKCSPLVINNIFVGNSATNGGGFYLVGNNMSHLINNTIVNNQATEGGGMVIANSSAPVLMNNIIWGNKASSNPAITLWDSSVEIAYCDIQGGWSGTGNINADPLFADTLFHLSDDSPCINAGIDSLLMGGIMCCCPPDDYDYDDGFTRPYPGTRPDIGADETDMVTGIDRRQVANIPHEFALYQNYPNPFNPSTTIEFMLPKSAFVTLKVYNLLGEEVATLVSENLSAGKYKYLWDATGLATGVYFYRLHAGEYKQTKKLILMR
jgi:hypothetical protein